MSRQQDRFDYACIDEEKDLSFIDSLQRILAHVLGKARNSAVVKERVMFEMIDTVMGVAIKTEALSYPSVQDSAS